MVDGTVELLVVEADVAGDTWSGLELQNEGKSSQFRPRGQAKRRGANKSSRGKGNILWGWRSEWLDG